MDHKKCSLTWHSYSDHLKSMMKEFIMNEDFSDVTLVTEDKKKIKANISILSACSPVFKDILKKEKKSNQIVYLRGVQFTEMESIIHFIYLGEATIYEERMDEFRAVAKSLEIEELCNAGPEPEDEPGDPVRSTENLEEKTVMSEQMQAPIERQRSSRDVNVKRDYECDQCHKTYSGHGALYTHKQIFHQGVRYACDQCDYQTTTQGILYQHIQSKHEGIKYTCVQCEYQADYKSNLTAHIRSKHEGVKYACDQCDYQFTRPSSFTKHIRSRHEGIKYACDQCDYKATTQGNLTIHIQSRHLGIMYSCDLCDQEFSQKGRLRTHIINKHEV